MALPENGTPWPPADRAAISTELTDATTRWASRRPADAKERRLPVIGDIASMSADLLFAETNHMTCDGDQAALDKLLDEAGIQNKLLEAAELASAFGGVYLRPVWDPDVSELPILTVMHPREAVPDFRWGRLRAVTYHRVVRDEKGVVWRHLERHERGVILHGLYRGTTQDLGEAMDLKSLPETAFLPDVVQVPGEILLSEYVPNMLPNRRHDGSPEGRPDWQGAEQWLDDLDNTWASWMRDIRLGRAMLVVPDEYLRTAPGEEARYEDQEVFAPMRQGSGEGERSITPVQFKLRVAEHEATANALLERIVDHSGYSPQSFGLKIEGRAESGTALKVREMKTYRTQGKKQRYWGTPVVNVLENMLRLQNTGAGLVLDSRDLRPVVQWSDAIPEDPSERAQTVQLLKVAQAASVRTRVQMVSPHLEGKDLEDEIEAVLKEEGLMVPDPVQSGLDIV